VLGSSTGLPPGATLSQRALPAPPQPPLPKPAPPAAVEPKNPLASATRLNGPLPSDPVKLWELVVGACASQHRMRMLVGNIKLIAKEEDRAILEVRSDLRTAAQSAERDLAALLSNAWGQDIKIDYLHNPEQSGEVGPAAAAAPNAAASTAHAASDNTPRVPITDHPLIKQAVELFGAKVVGVQPRRKQSE
jgi:hypothetical protein